MSVDLRKLEIDRIENLVRNFGWVTVTIEHPPGEIIITFKKEIEEIVPGGIAGPE